MTRTRKILLAGLVATSIPLAAFAGGMGPGGFGGGFGGHGGFGGPCGGRAETAEEAREHADRKADRMLDLVDATDDQRARVDAVLDVNVPKLFAVHEDGRALREEGRALFTAEQIDAAAVEALRAEAITLADEGSKIMVDTMVQIANILTVEQREELSAEIERIHEEGGPGMRRGFHGERGDGARGGGAR